MTNKVMIPSNGEKIYFVNNKINIPNNPIIPYIEGDGIGVDITNIMIKVINAAVTKAYNGTKRIYWIEVFAGEKSTKIYGANNFLPQETIDLIKYYHIAIKGPLTTPVGEGIRSLNVTLRQTLDLYICLRPIVYYHGIPSPVKYPEKINMVIFRENSEDIYSGIEWPANSAEASKLINFLQNQLQVNTIRFSDNCGIGIKTCSQEATYRLVRAAIKYAIDHDRSSITLVHKGNIMKYTEGAFKNWGYELAKLEFNATTMPNNCLSLINPKNNKHIMINDVIADAFLQQILLHPENYDVIVCMNLNGDYISDALAAQVGGLGIAPGANLGFQCAIFEPTHGSAPKYAGQNKVNPSSIILSAEMMLRHLQWFDAANLIIKAIKQTFINKMVTYDFARLIPDATLLNCSEFGDEIIKNIEID